MIHSSTQFLQLHTVICIQKVSADCISFRKYFVVSKLSFLSSAGKEGIATFKDKTYHIENDGGLPSRFFEENI
jgi:hypothetical protein